MANDIDKLRRQLAKIEREVDQIIRVTISQFANRMFAEAMANLGHPELVSTFRLVFEDNGYTVYITTESKIAAYIEFGTGTANFREMLRKVAETPEDIGMISEEAIKFFETGDGTMPARSYLFPAYFKYRDQVLPEINKRIDQLFRRYA